SRSPEVLSDELRPFDHSSLAFGITASEEEARAVPYSSSHPHWSRNRSRARRGRKIPLHTRRNRRRRCLSSRRRKHTPPCAPLCQKRDPPQPTKAFERKPVPSRKLLEPLPSLFVL